MKTIIQHLISPPQRKTFMNTQSFTKHFALTLVALCMAAFVHGQSINLISPSSIDGTVSNTVTLSLSGFGSNTPTLAGVIISPPAYTTFPISSASPTSVTFSIPAGALPAGIYDVFVFSFGTGFVQTTGSPFSASGFPIPFNPGLITFGGLPGPNLDATLSLTTANPVIDATVKVIIQRSTLTGLDNNPTSAVVTPTFLPPFSVNFEIPNDLRHVGATNGTSATYTFFLQKGTTIVPGHSAPYMVTPTTMPTIASFSPTSATADATVTITGTYLCQGSSPTPLPVVDIYSWNGVSLPLLPTASVIATVTKANGTEATFKVPKLPPGNYRIRYRYNGTNASFVPFTVLKVLPTITITSFSPKFATRNSSPTKYNGTIITISGSGLSGLNTSYVVEFQTSTPGTWTQGVPGVLSAGVPNPTLSVNAAGTIVYIRAPHDAVTGKIRLRSLIGGGTVVSTTNINIIGTPFAGWSAEEENNGGETDNVQIIGGADSSSATLFPNPTSDAVSVTTQGFTGEVTISLMDMMGATIETKAVSAGAEAQFNLANRQRGVYVIRLTDEAGHTELRRVVKE